MLEWKRNKVKGKERAKNTYENFLKNFRLQKITNFYFSNVESGMSQVIKTTKNVSN